MPNSCGNRSSGGVRDANNNTSCTDLYGRTGAPGRGSMGPQMNPKVTAKVMFGTVEALRDLRLKEQAQRQQKK